MTLCCAGMPAAADDDGGCRPPDGSRAAARPGDLLAGWAWAGADVTPMGSLIQCEHRPQEARHHYEHQAWERAVLQRPVEAVLDRTRKD